MPDRHLRRHRLLRAASPEAGRWRRTCLRWLFANSILTGLFALLWLVLRSGRRPSRLAYPCQRAALATATTALGAPAAAALVLFRHRLARASRSPVALASAGVALFAGLLAWNLRTRAEAAAPALAFTAPDSYRAEVFHAAACGEEPVGDRFPCLEALLGLMGRHGVKLFRSADESPLAGPEGIVGANDVVVIKINYQWSDRGGTNTDLLRGLIRKLVEHPDGFGGEIVVAENAQFATTSNFDRSANNAQDPTQSPRDVVAGFAAQGHAVSQFDWTTIRAVEAAEYSTGDLADGYVLYPYDAALHGRLSYPKFRSSAGTYISLRDGIWDEGSGSYDRERLKLINLPVLKSHHAVYGATACVKNFMGLVTDSLGTGSHGAIRYGLLGALLGEIRPPDLNLLDAIWVNGNPYSGPSTPYAGATRRNELVASLDPVAADIWAVGNILVPTFAANGFSPPWPAPSADPNDPAGAFRVYLDQSMSQMLAAGYPATNDPAQIDLQEIVTLFADGFDSGDTSGWSLATP